jgi:hypothetical protein
MRPEPATHARQFERLANAPDDLATLPDQCAFRRWLLAEPNHPESAIRNALPGVIVVDEDNQINSISP